MSNQFNKVINGRQFNFQSIEIAEKNGYHVDVKDEEGTRWEFRMFDTNDNHIEAEKLPSWIAGLEEELRRAISEHE